METIKAMVETTTTISFNKETVKMGEEVMDKENNRTTMAEAIKPKIPSSRLLVPMNLNNLLIMAGKNIGATIIAAGHQCME